MPSHDSLGLDDHEGAYPPRPESAECDPESSISRRKARARLFLSGDRELLPQGQLDDGLLSACPEQGQQRSEENECVSDEGANHRGILNAVPEQVETESRAPLLVASVTEDSASRRMVDGY